MALINICNWMAGALLEQARQDIFAANPDVKVAGVLNPTAEVRVDGRFMVSGS